jgi:hypothetical protein
MQRLKLPHFHLNGVRVGTDASDLMEPSDEQNLDCAVQLCRDIFAAAGIGVGRFERNWWIPLSDNTGFDILDDKCEAEDLVDEYTVPNDGVDVFFVDVFVDPDTAGILGYFPKNGDGVVVESRSSTFLGTARTMAHELGHLLGGLGDNDVEVGGNPDPTNLLSQTQFAATQPDNQVAIPGSTSLNVNQVNDIKGHANIKPPC